MEHEIALVEAVQTKALLCDLCLPICAYRMTQQMPSDALAVTHAPMVPASTPRQCEVCVPVKVSTCPLQCEMYFPAPWIPGEVHAGGAKEAYGSQTGKTGSTASSPTHMGAPLLPCTLARHLPLLCALGVPITGCPFVPPCSFGQAEIDAAAEDDTDDDAKILRLESKIEQMEAEFDELMKAPQTWCDEGS